jgi:hypothetical protein
VIKKRSKKLSLLLVLMMLATMFVGVGTASASSTYTAIKTQTIDSISTAGTIGTYLTSPRIQIDIPNAAALTSGDILDITFPSGVKLDNTQSALDSPRVIFNTEASGGSTTGDCVNSTTGAIGLATLGGAGTSPTASYNAVVYAPALLSSNAADINCLNGAVGVKFNAYAPNVNTIEIKITANNLTGAGRLYVDLIAGKVTSTYEGDITATVSTPSNTGFTSGSVVFAKFISGSSATTTSVASVTTMGSSVTTMDVITIQEATKNSIESTEVITLKLPAGFKWDTKGTASGAWAMTTGSTFTTALNADTRKLDITCLVPGNYASEGRIYLTGSKIVVDDDSVAKKGDVIINVTSDKGNVSTQEVKIASYVDYTAVVSEKTSVDVVAGRDDTELGSFNIKEGIAGSLIPGRTVTLTLPSGVKWDDTNYAITTGANTAFTGNVIGGENWINSNAAGASQSLDSSKRVAKITLPTAGVAKSNLDIKKLKVKISPDYTGDIKVIVGGTAGAAGEVKVATVKAPLTIAAGATADLNVGKQKQAIADVTITEALKETLKSTAAANTLQLTLPGGSKFAALPVATVTAGDLVIDKVAYTTGNAGIDITIKSTSSTPATITLSNLFVTLDRSIAEGDFKLSVNGPNSTAVTNQAAAADFNVSTITSAVIGQVVTPASDIVNYTSTFVLGADKYMVNGVEVAGVAASFAKNNRTYLPIRDVARALGIDDSNIIWNQEKQTVTLLKGERFVQLTLGSNVIKINGLDVYTMDVIPEVSANRTFLPAAWVAQAFGQSATYDAATQTVTIK